MTDINLSNEEKFKLAVQLAQDSFKNNLANKKAEENYDRAAKHIFHNYQAINSAIDKLNNRLS